MRSILIKIIFGASFILLAIAFVLFYLHLAPISNFFIVKLESLRGLKFLGGNDEVLAIFISSFAVFLVNALLSGIFYKRDRFLSHLIAFFNLFFSLLILIAVGVIIATN